MSELELKIGHYLKFVGSDVPPRQDKQFFKVTAKEAFNYKTNDSIDTEFTAVASGATSGFQPIDQLEPDESPLHLYYVMWGIKDGCRYWVKIPTGVNRLGIDLDRDVGYVDNRTSPWTAPSPDHGFWLLHDVIPAFEASNITPYSLTPELYFRGWIYELEQIQLGSPIHSRLLAWEQGGGGGQPFTYITIGGIK